MNGNSTVSVVVKPDGHQVDVGLHALGRFADQLGLGDELFSKAPGEGERLRRMTEGRC